MTRKYAVAVIPEPTTLEQVQFDLDALTLLSMLSGMCYEDAALQARKDIKELQANP